MSAFPLIADIDIEVPNSLFLENNSLFRSGKFPVPRFVKLYRAFLKLFFDLGPSAVKK